MADKSGHPTPGRDYFNIHAILAQLVGLIERYHQRPTPAMQSRTLDNASQLTSKIGRCEFETNLNGRIRGDEIAFP